MGPQNSTFLVSNHTINFVEKKTWQSHVAISGTSSQGHCSFRGRFHLGFISPLLLVEMQVSLVNTSGFFQSDPLLSWWCWRKTISCSMRSSFCGLISPLRQRTVFTILVFDIIAGWILHWKGWQDGNLGVKKLPSSCPKWKNPQSGGKKMIPLT